MTESIFNHWGLADSSDPTIPSWGARAIYQNSYIDILYDRQSLIGGSESDRIKLGDWLNKIGLPALRKLVVTENLYSDERRFIRFEQGGYYIEANPNKSYGYLYIGAGHVK